MGSPAPLQGSTAVVLPFPERPPRFALLCGLLFRDSALELAAVADKTGARLDIIAALQVARMARAQLRRCFPTPPRPWPSRGSQARAVADKALDAWSQLAPHTARLGVLLRREPGRVKRRELPLVGRRIGPRTQIGNDRWPP